MQAVAAEIRPSTIAELREHGEALFQAHYDEIALNKDVMRLDPDWQRYERMEACGILLCLAAWADCKMVGYSVTAVLPHPHYKQLRVAQNDVLFVAASCRSGPTGRDLIAATEAAAKGVNAGIIMWHAKPGTALEHVLPRIGYGVQDTLFSKVL